ncbi:hypothetical protein [Burkholderia phage BCSR5]|nr:hypothetical protein [Burkholderia phage BCSR5]
MKCKLESDLIQDALRVIQRLAPPTSGNVNIHSEGKKLYLKSQSETAQCDIQVPCEVKGDALFAVPLDSLVTATKGRKELEVEFNKQMLNIQSGKLKVQLATVDAIVLEDEQDAKKEKGKSWKVDAEQAAWLKAAVAQAALKPTALLQTFMPLSVRLTDKKAFVACYDTHHMSFVTSKELKGDLDFTLPLDTMTAVLDVFHRSAFKLEVSGAEVKISNKLASVILQLPVVEGGETLSIEDVIQIEKQAAKVDGTMIELDKGAVTAYLDSVRAIVAKERAELLCSTEKGKVKFKVATANGSASESMKAAVKKAQEFKVDLEYFDEAVRKSRAVGFKLVENEFLLFSTGPGCSLVVSLNQESSE